MWRRIALIALLVTAAGQTGLGQQPGSKSLVAKHNWAQFDLVLGRITATHIRNGQKNCFQHGADLDEVQELLSVSGDSDIPTIRYELVDPEQTLTVEVVRRNQVVIERKPRNDSQIVPLDFHQPARGPIKLRLGPDEAAGEYVVDSLWHLLLAHREMCQRELLPILQLLRPNWRLPETAQQIEQALLRWGPATEAVSREALADLVEQLGSPAFATRQQADRRLRSLGVTVLPCLQEIDPTTLDREQRQRLARIRRDLTVTTADTADRVAAWLSEDRDVWLAMLSHADPARRQAAVTRLAAIDPSVAHFDPYAEEAQRQQQLELLRLRLGSRP